MSEHIENEIRYLELPQEYSPRLWNAKSACTGWRAPSGVNLSAIPPQAIPYRGRFFGKPLRAISRFSHQDATPPPSPLVGEGGRGDEGQRCTGMQNIAHLSQKLYT